MKQDATRWDTATKLEWRDLIDTLADDERTVPLWPVTVRRVKVRKDMHGFTIRHENRFEIRIASAADFDTAARSLQHEWAHTMAGVNGDHKADHGVLFQMAVAAVEAVFDDWMKET